jgi:hypothetical protein
VSLWQTKPPRNNPYQSWCLSALVAIHPGKKTGTLIQKITQIFYRASVAKPPAQKNSGKSVTFPHNPYLNDKQKQFT